MHTTGHGDNTHMVAEGAGGRGAPGGPARYAGWGRQTATANDGQTCNQPALQPAHRYDNTYISTTTRTHVHRHAPMARTQ